MAIFKNELEQELRAFMGGFAVSVENLFVPRGGGALLGHPGQGANDVALNDVVVEGTKLWDAVMTMFDYGVEGVPHESFGAGQTIDGAFADVELFVQALPSFKLLLAEDEVDLPALTQRTVAIAVARHLLDGGERFRTGENEEQSGYLNFAEIALLADMDERSVRNAANPKLPDALATQNFGRRTLIQIDDARRWLAGRKGFVPTKGFVKEPEAEASKWTDLGMPYPLYSRICEQANTAGVLAWELISKLLDQQQTATESKQ